MEVIPAIDIRDGNVVRLTQGDYARETVYANDPVLVAYDWALLGAPWLHVVDLDGAREGHPVNDAVLAEIVRAVPVPVQAGGGIRTLEAIGKLLGLGVQRVVLGTVAVEQPELVAEACRRYGDAVVVGIDARDGLVAVRGWRDKTSWSAADLMAEMEAVGVRRFIYTDVARDGTLEGPNLRALRAILKKATKPVIASGGVSGLEDIRRLAALPLEGVLVGKALYTGALDLREALAAAHGEHAEG
ncbi:MAG: 1-(5-phosphoribosyl)-5-[(5-phosphoribosylamino)methylideneamino]imidazole-4-carboxamide isomerase [Chloroflexi bacterium]|nr:1-(5-phosphoribosyl)-5-[(5-phosphoribosylamino)methylideneamino]imidazole-4-carboxamide isomerase [Chloroflexota bacterium]